jgi:hypothetical protein
VLGLAPVTAAARRAITTPGGITLPADISSACCQVSCIAQRNSVHVVKTGFGEDLPRVVRRSV